MDGKLARALVALKRALKNKRLLLIEAVDAALVACLVVGYSLWATQAAAADAAVQEQILEAEKAAHRGAYPTDGYYTGTAQGYGGTIEMQVLIENGYIEELEVLSAKKEDAPYMDQAVAVLDDVLDEQTTAVDTVSGCTYSSVGILNAITEALEKSIAGEQPDAAVDEGGGE